jgi:hypothetical protein
VHAVSELATACVRASLVTRSLSGIGGGTLMGIGNDVRVAGSATACGHGGLRVRSRGLAAVYNDEPV